MKFKLVHVRPHVWFFKQKETVSKPASNDDTSSSEGTGAYVYKRSTSLKLVKSDRVPGRTCKPLHTSKSSSAIGIAGLRTHPQGKDVKVCTVVDAGCTCRATLTSQHKAQKKGLGAYVPNAPNGGLGSLHDVCKPRWAPHVFEAKREDVADVGSRHDVCRPRRRARQLNPNHAASASNTSALTTPVGASNSVVSRLVCKSTQDVVKTHAQLFDVERCNVVSKLANSLESEYARTSYAGEDRTGAAPGLDVHQLECRLRNAGLAERRRSSKKASKYYEEGSSGVSSTNSTNHSNTDSLITCSTTELQDMLLNANPAFDTDAPSTSDSMLSLEDLRASIEQRKLATYHNLAQASLCGKGDGMRENVAATTCSPSSLSSGNTPACAQNLMRKEDSSAKHSNVGASKRLHFSECDDVSKQGVLSSKQSPRKACTGTSYARKEAMREEYSRLPRKASRRIDLNAQKGSDVQQELKKSSVNRVKGEIHDASKHSQEVDNKSERRSFARPGSGHICAGAAHDDVGQQAEKQALSSSSCEIQVLSDYNFDLNNDGNHAYPVVRMHVNGALSSSAVPHAQGAALSKLKTPSSATPRALTTAASPTVDASKPNSVEHELMRSESAVAMVKSSYDPKLDFKESMLEMVVAKRLRTPRQLQQLLQCYLSLNPSHYHPTIIKVFHDLCSELFN